MEKTEDVNPASRASRVHYDPTPVVRNEHAEGTFTRVLEHQAAKIPSDVFLFAALAAMGGSLAAEMAGRSRLSRFLGMWPPTLLIMGVYNKMVKLMGPR